jgi:cytochrome P450
MSLGTSAPEPGIGEIRLSTYATAREAMRSRDLRQGLYDQGHALMEKVIVNLHGPEHTSRRRLENRLFRRDTFLHWENALIPASINASLAPFIGRESVDMVQLARNTMMRIAAEIAGIDLGEDERRFILLADLMARMARASNVNHFIGDKSSVINDGNEALQEYEQQFFNPAHQRRVKMLQSYGEGKIQEHELPKDVLTTLLANQDALEIPMHEILREIAYYPWVGSHSTSGAFVNMMDHVFDWIENDSTQRHALASDILELQRMGFESLRLHPASPVSERVAVADILLSDGTFIPKDSRVIIELKTANRDKDVFGLDSDEFNPRRHIAADTSAWGLSFGTGFHACVGQEVAGGTDLGADETGIPLHGAIATMAQILLQHGARRDPHHPARRDEQSVRHHFLEYPVLIG